jgi:hypothetical protein
MFESVGCGSQLAKFLIKQMHAGLITVKEAVELGVYVIKRCDETVDGCDGPISVLSYELSNTPQWNPYSPEDVAAIAARFPKQKLRNNLLKFWTDSTPHIERKFTPFKKLPEGGSVSWVRAAPTKSTFIKKPSTSRKSKRER